MMNRFVKLLNAAITVGLVLIIGVAAVLAISARRSRDALPTFMGRKVLTVLSGSMEPLIHTGDVIIVRPLAAEEAIGEGDIITFRTRGKADMLITHRVVGLVSLNGIPSAYVTKGDANDSEDLTAVAREQVVGRYEARVPYFGYLASFLRKPAGMILFVIIPGLILIAGELRHMWKILAEAESARRKGGDQAGH